VLTSGQGISLPPGVAPTATFADGSVSGSTGCNRYNGPYTIDGESLEIGPVASTLMACPPPRDAIESAYVAALDRVQTWAIDGEELVLSDDEGEELLRYAGPSRESAR
jgi:putative lipoprotein